jgi:hypothetical protein
MSNPSQPYKLGSAKPVGDAVARAGADIGTAISEGVQAVTGLKKHRANLEHIATQTQLGHERMLESMSHADSLAAKAKERGQDVAIKADHSSIDYTSTSVKPPKSTAKTIAETVATTAANAVVDVAKDAIGSRKGTGSFRAPGAPKPVPRGSGAGVKSGAVAKPTPKSSGSAKMKDFNADKKARGITGGSKVNAASVRTRMAKNAANPKIFPAGTKSTPEQVKVNVAQAWRDKKKTMRAAKKDQ